jgi:hypothetical protein
MFGIKEFGDGPGTIVPTHEVVNGKRILVNAKFRDYKSWVDGINDRVSLTKRLAVYEGYREAKTLGDAVQSLAPAPGRQSYATEPDYAGHIKRILLPIYGEAIWAKVKNQTSENPQTAQTSPTQNQPSAVSTRPNSSSANSIRTSQAQSQNTLAPTDQNAANWENRVFTAQKDVPISLILNRVGSKLQGYSYDSEDLEAEGFEPNGEGGNKIRGSIVKTSGATEVVLERLDAKGSQVDRIFKGAFVDAAGKTLIGTWTQLTGAKKSTRIELKYDPNALNKNLGQSEERETAFSVGEPDSLDTLMGFQKKKPRYSAKEIGLAREKIKKEEGVEKRGDLYQILQKKVIYRNQRNNLTDGANSQDVNANQYDRVRKIGDRIGDIMCQLTALAMCLEYVGIKNREPEKFPQFEDYLEDLRVKRKLPHRTEMDGWGGVAEAAGAKYHSFNPGNEKSGWISQVLPRLRAGNAIMMSISGHIVRVQDVTKNGIIVDDPFGYGIHVTYSKDKKGKLVQSFDWEKGNDWKTENGAGARGEDNLWSWDFIRERGTFWVAEISK